MAMAMATAMATGTATATVMATAMAMAMAMVILACVVTATPTMARRATTATISTPTLGSWGEGTWAQLGYGNTNHIGDDELPSSVGPVDLGDDVQQWDHPLLGPQ
jgi:hypothetical protein